MTARGVLLLAASLSCGCYAYLPPPAGAPLAGRETQLSLSDSGAVVLGAIIGPAAETIDGRVLEEPRDSYVLAVSNVHFRNGDDVRWRGERVVVSRALVTGAGERRFSPTRTGLFAGLVAIALAGAHQALAGSGSGAGGSGAAHGGGTLR